LAQRERLHRNGAATRTEKLCGGVMTFQLDKEVADVLAPMAAAMAQTTPPPVGDVQARRELLEPLLAQTGTAQPMPTDVTIRDLHPS